MIAVRLRRTASAVSSRMTKLKRVAGGHRAPPPEYARGALTAAVVRLCGPGISDHDVARVLDRDPSVISRTRRAAGLPAGGEKHKHRGAWKPGDPGGLKAAVVRLYGRWGRSDAEIARAAGVPRHAVTYLREKMGIPACGRAGRPAPDPPPAAGHEPATVSSAGRGG